MSDQDLENVLHIDLEGGRVVIDLLPDVAPGHVARIKELSIGFVCCKAENDGS